MELSVVCTLANKNSSKAAHSKAESNGTAIATIYLGDVL